MLRTPGVGRLGISACQTQSSSSQTKQCKWDAHSWGVTSIHYDGGRSEGSGQATGGVCCRILSEVSGVLMLRRRHASVVLHGRPSTLSPTLLMQPLKILLSLSATVGKCLNIFRCSLFGPPFSLLRNVSPQDITDGNSSVFPTSVFYIYILFSFSSCS